MKRSNELQLLDRRVPPSRISFIVKVEGSTSTVVHHDTSIDSTKTPSLVRWVRTPSAERTLRGADPSLEDLPRRPPSRTPLSAPFPLNLLNRQCLAPLLSVTRPAQDCARFPTPSPGHPRHRLPASPHSPRPYVSLPHQACCHLWSPFVHALP